MKSDVKDFCDKCISCQYVKGGKKHRAPLVIRYQPKPREHIFLDYLGPIYSDYYILDIVDYSSGFVMLIPTNGCDGETVIHALINYWIRIFGYFKVFESDWGSGFSNLLIKYLSKMLDFDIELAEPRNHRSIGKVERTIGFLQSIINHYNLLLNNRLTDEIDNLDQAWLIIKTIIPFIQLAFNQRILPISGVSPNMVIFGTNMNDAIDIGRLQYQAKLAKDDPKLLKKDYEILENIRRAIRKMGAISHTNWKKNTYFSRKYYNKKYNINDEKIKRNLEIFKVGSKVLYYIGDKQVARGKWRAKWTGPWLVEKHLNQSTVIISDPTTGIPVVGSEIITVD